MTNETNNTPKPSTFKRSVKKFFLIFTLSAFVIWLIYYFICGITYSEGTRSGILTKVSKKGFVFKTYEGEMNIGGINSGEGTIMPQTTFSFSVTDPKVYDQLEKDQGKKLVLHYKQVIHNFFWQGESDYFVQAVNVVQ